MFDLIAAFKRRDERLREKEESSALCVTFWFAWLSLVMMGIVYAVWFS